MGVLAGAGVRILLIGTGTHKRGSQLPDLPAVANTVTDLAATLVERSGAHPDRIRTLVDPADRRVLAGEVADAAQAAEDVLLLCYIGHGLLGRDGELHLATRDTDHLTDGLDFKALSYATVRGLLADCRARSVIVLLDCCFSGRANRSPRHLDSDLFPSPAPRGGYLLTSAAPEELALAPEGERYTAFTGELIRLLHNGDPAGPAELTLDHIYRYLERMLPEQGRPTPHRQAADRAGELVLAPNRAYRPPLLTLRRTTGEAHPDADATCPYRGLAAYHVQDARYFFGREQLTGQLVSRVAALLPNTGLLIVVGPSGSGKSSLLRAGFIPALDEGLPGVPGSRAWPRLVLTPGAHPLAALADRLAGPAGERADDLRTRLAADPAELAEVAHEVSRRHARGADAAGRRLVLVVDQFEEVFTTCEGARERRAFIDVLCTAAESAALVVLGLRADFYSQCAAESRLVKALQHHQVIVTPMTNDELRAAIERPAEQASLLLEPGLVDLMLRDLRSSDSAEPASGNGGLPLLSHALLATWQQRDGAVLTLAGYEATGGIWRAVTRTAEGLYARLTEPERETARLLLLRMVRLGEGGAEDTRRRVRLAELPTTDAVARVLTAFADARLVTIGTDTAEIAHEALLRAWPRLRRWIDADRAGLLTGQQLAEAADAWDREGRDPSVLYRGARLDTARQWADDARSELGELATSFLTASIAAARRRTRRGRELVATLTVLLLLAVTGGVIAFQQRSEALDRSALISSRQIAGEADSVRGTDPSLAMQLALAAYRTAPTTEARSSLLASTHGPYATVVARHTGKSKGVAVSSDGHTVASWGGDNTLRLTDLTHPDVPSADAALPTDGGGDVVPIAFSPSRPVLAADVRGSIRLWDTADPHHPLAKATVTGQPASRLSFSPDGRVLAAVGEHGYLHLWDVTDSSHPSAYFTTAIDAQDVFSAAFSPGGKTLATASFDGAIRLWDLTDLRHPAVEATVALTDVDGRGHAAFSANFSPDGQLLAVAGTAGLSVWNVTDPRHPTTKKEIDPAIGVGYLSTTFSSDGRFVAGSLGNGPITLWSVASLGKDTFTPEKIATLPQRDGVISIAFTRDGTLVAGGGDGVVRDWHLPADLRTATIGDTSDSSLSQFSPDGRVLSTLAGEAESRMLRLWDVADPHHPVEGVALPVPTAGGGLLSTGRTLVTFDLDHMATRLWEVTDAHHVTQQAVLAEPYDPQPLNREHLAFVGQSAGFSPDHRILAVGSPVKSIVRLWDITDPRHPVIVATLPTGRAEAVGFSDHGHSLYVFNQVPGFESFTAQVWDVTDPRHPVVVFTSAVELTGAASADKILITHEASDDLIRLWDMTDPSHPAVVDITKGEATSTFTLHTDNRLLVVATNGRIWLDDITNPRNPTVESVISTAGSAASLDVSPDGRTLGASFSGESLGNDTLEFWSIADPRKPQRLTSASDVNATSLFPQVFSPDSRTLATTTKNAANVRLLDLDIDRLTRYLCSTGTTISRSQWEQHIPDLPYQSPCG